MQAMTIPSRTAIDSEALGAFAHDVRTPLNAVSMVVEVARRLSSGGELQLDDELTEMLMTSVKEIERLVSDLQDVSRIERGKQRMAPGPAQLEEVLADAAAIVRKDIALDCSGIRGEGPWDRDRLGRMIADLARSANRCGAGNGEVRVTCEEMPSGIAIVISSGTPGREPRAVASDAGWGFFRCRALTQAMGGTVEATRTERYMSIRMSLPR
jgi:signal transduction histidine kinase